jgi:hypothetical protein
VRKLVDPLTFVLENLIEDEKSLVFENMKLSINFFDYENC